MSAVSLGVQRFSGGRVIESTIGTIGRNFKDFTLVALILLGLPGVLLQVLNLSVGGPFDFSPLKGGVLFFGGLLVAVCNLLAYAAIIRGAVADFSGRRPAVRELLAGAVPSILPLFGVGFCWVLGVLLGFFFFIVPSLILMTIWSVAIPVQVIEKPAGLGAFGRSAQLTRGCRWGIFGLLLLYGVVLIVVGAAMGMTLRSATVGVAWSAAQGTNLGPMAYIGLIVGGAVNSVLSMAGAVFGAALYFELRSAKEGSSPRDLASVFE